LPDAPEKDPIVSRSLAGYFVIVAFLLIFSLSWSLYDEFFGLRPWKSYERQFATLYAALLKKEIPEQEKAQKAIEDSPEYQALEKQLKDAHDAAAPQLDKIHEQTAAIDAKISAVLGTLTNQRAKVGSMIYVAEHTPMGPGRTSLEHEVDEYKKGPFKLDGPPYNGKSFTFEELESEFSSLQTEKGKLQQQEGEILKPQGAITKKLAAYIHDHLNGLTTEQMRGLLTKAETMKIEIKQINIPDAGIVDRCESCHVGIREPILLTRQNMGGEKDPMSAAFTSHPDMELLQIHDPEKFGCTPCHNGNGMQLDSVEMGHGEYEHWLHPLYHKAHMQAGCQQCHAADMVVDHAPDLSAGKQLLQWKGCIGCHRFQGYDPEPEELVANQQAIMQMETERGDDLRNAQRDIDAGDHAPDNETARKDYTDADALRVASTQVSLQLDQLELKAKYLMMSRKKVGPDLKEIREKVRPEWIPVWLKNPHAWRPTTKMPRFRLDHEDIEDISAYLWQSAINTTLPHQAPGDPVKGKESFETRGCMGCHSVGEGASQVGGWFAANLSRVGEKDNYDFLVRWIHNPRERTRPYCPFEKRDITDEDYKKHGLPPYTFDLNHTKCPNDGHEMVVEQMTVMPNLRLSWDEARNIASYLETLKHTDANYPPAPYMNDPKLAAEGKAKIRFYGCAGCHEIAGMEDEGRIGTELTAEGSKPLEQIDFALYIREAKQEDWYNHKGFFERKLAKPEMYDKGMIKTEAEQLKMPDFFEPASSKVTKGMPDLAPADQKQISELSTFLMGSVTSEIPQRYWYLPADQRRDVQDGWWIVKKYNCEGCHQFRVGQDSVLMDLPRYQTLEGKDQLPPKLLTEGARVNPEWLAKFLANPALSDTDTDRDGVRPYLKTRMPTFYFSPIEVRKLVRFFQALSDQPMPYIPRRLDPLTSKETEMARALFTSRAAPCLKCHATGNEAHDKYATAPNFLLAPERLKPDWVKHWILDPAMISPGTAMPSGLFKKAEDGRNVFAGPTPAIFNGYTGDQADLLVRYMFEITPEEQRKLTGLSAGSMKQTTEKGEGPDHARRTLIGMLVKSH
jgi:hypothetical protein